jgi:2-polyprenyl-3-methyl-5-hydroxy-6-metoxy-1,4-benzoquinol methylase
MDTCHLCNNSDLLPLINFGNHPIAHHFLTTVDQVEYSHHVNLCFCNECGLIQLNNPIPPEHFYTNYNWLSSWKLQPHMQEVIKYLIDLPRLNAKSKILEIGCNDGSFLDALRQNGYQNLLGVEPAKDACSVAIEKGINAINTYFNQTTADEIENNWGKFDLVIFRQVLEHIIDLRGIREALNQVTKPGSYVLIEVPNFDFSLQTYDYSSIWEEHVNFFTKSTMNRFLAEVGIKVIHTTTANFCGEALIVFGEKTKEIDHSFENDDEIDIARKNAIDFHNRWPSFKKDFSEFLKNRKDEGVKVALYGAGARACSIINFLELAPFVDFVVDDQVEKQGKYMPGSRLQIFPSTNLVEKEVGLCLLSVNAENENFVIKKHNSFIEKGGRFLSINPPSDILPAFWAVKDGEENQCH